jgi:hypothetical protein
MADKDNAPAAVTDAFDQRENKRESWGEWSSRHYNKQYENWTPWLEDQYLKWFGKDNKASYATKGIYLHHSYFII